MLMTAVTGIDDGNAGFLSGNDRSTLFGMAHCADIGVAGNDADRVGNTFAFGSGGIGCIRKSEHFAAKVHHSGFKA